MNASIAYRRKSGGTTPFALRRSWLLVDSQASISKRIGETGPETASWAGEATDSPSRECCTR
jgi:hypothetical protein